jgi:hypothetical protein
MFGDSAPEAGHKKFPTYVVVSCAAFLVVGIYLGWTFWSRSQENRALEEKIASQQRAQDRKIFEAMGGNRFAILGFYADPPSAHSGDPVDLCYGVSNAQSVKLEPQPEPVWPAQSHCVKVSPHKTTTYTLTAEDASGQTKTATVVVKVQ